MGVKLGTTRPSPDAVRAAVRRALHEPSFAAAAGRVRDEMPMHDAATESAGLLERLAATGRPVLRDEAAGPEAERAFFPPHTAQGA